MKFSMIHTFTVTAPQKRVFEALVDPAVIQKRERGQSTNLDKLTWRREPVVGSSIRRSLQSGAGRRRRVWERRIFE